MVYTMSWRFWGDVKVQRRPFRGFLHHSMLFSVLTLLLLIWSRQMQLEARSCKASSLAQNFTNLVCFIFLPSITLELFYGSNQGIPDWLESEEVKKWWERGAWKLQFAVEVRIKFHLQLYHKLVYSWSCRSSAGLHQLEVYFEWIGSI